MPAVFCWMVRGNEGVRPSSAMMKQPIVGFHQDEQGDWVADLACGHGQHVRHQPPFTNRPWVLTADGREQHLGTDLNCKKCEEVPLELPRPFG